jgi:hypothetical protein
MRPVISFAILLMAVAAPAFGQLDAFTLHAKYGAPLDRETFTVRPGTQMVVDYGPSKQVCRIQLPAGMRIVGTVPPGAVTEQEVKTVIDEVVPPSVRGKQINQMQMITGLSSIAITEYEHVTISETKVGNVGQEIHITVKDNSCPEQKPGN